MPPKVVSKRVFPIFLLSLAIVLTLSEQTRALEVLVFSKTTGYRHEDAILAGNDLFARLGQTSGWDMHFSEESSDFNEARLGSTDVVVWNNVSGNLLNDAERQAFQQYLERGGGLVAIHNAIHAEMSWPFYAHMLGTRFQGHGAGKDQIQDAEVIVEKGRHPTCWHFPPTFTRNDEWYNFTSNPRLLVTVLMRLNETTLAGPNMGGDHPITWINQSDGLTREGIAVDATRAYAMEATFRITTTGGVQSFAMNFLQDDQPPSERINTWTLNLDLNGDGTNGVIKFMGFVNGSFDALGPSRPAKWARADTDYIYRIDVNRRLDGAFAPKWVTARITTLDGTVQDCFEVDYSKFRWQPDLTRPAHIGLNTHFATWEARDLRVFYTDIPNFATASQGPNDFAQ